jgi:hypothetical protein
MRGIASYLHHFVGYGGYVRRLRLLSIDIIVNGYIFWMPSCAEIYYVFGLYSMVAESVVCTHAYI